MLMSEAELSEIRPDYIILNEFHHGGAEQWGAGVQKLLSIYPNAPVLGLSATSIRYLDNQQDMADELFDGNVASEVTLGEAIVRGILNPPKYVLSVFSYQKDLEKYERHVKRAKSKAVCDAAEQYLEALRRALAHAEGLDEIFVKHMTDRFGKYIVFCANKEFFYKKPKYVMIGKRNGDGFESAFEFHLYQEIRIPGCRIYHAFLLFCSGGDRLLGDEENCWRCQNLRHEVSWHFISWRSHGIPIKQFHL